MEAPRKEIQLPPSADGYYRFGSLPGLIADALHPQDDCPRDHLTKVVIWRAEDGRRVGRYYECLPPAGALLTSFERVDEWTAVPLSPVEVKRTWRRARYNVMRRLPESMRQYWPDGSLVVEAARTPESDTAAWNWAMEEDSYATQLHQAVQLPSGTPGRLQVVDGNHNEIECRDGSALNDGYVHIAWLNDWGATQQPVNVFHNSPGTTVEPIDVSEQQPLLPWKMEVQAIAAELWITLRKAGANPTIAGIVDQVARRCAERGIKTQIGVNPRSGYLRTHVLSSQHWTPPPDDRRG